MIAKQFISEIGTANIYDEKEWKEFLGHFDFEMPLETSDISELKSRIINNKKGTMHANPNQVAKNLGIDDIIKKKDKVIGIVSGCFDILHLGHLRGFTFAKSFLSKENGKLLVLVLPDSEIRKKKGCMRPIMKEYERIELISHVDCVDYITLLDSADCKEAIKNLQPKYFFKSKEDTVQSIVNEEIVQLESTGGRVIFFPRRRSFSTTKIIEKLRHGAKNGRL